MILQEGILSNSKRSSQGLRAKLAKAGVKECEEIMESKIKNDLEIHNLKKALRQAILDTKRMTETYIDDPAGSTSEIKWPNRVKDWAKLCDLDLDKYDPF